MLLFLVGLLALLGQVILLRELNVASYGVELVYAVALAAWMTGSAAGAAFLPRRPAVTAGRLSWLLAIAAAAIPAEVAVIRVSRLALGGVPGAFLPVEQQVLLLAVSVLPPSIVLGLAFVWSADLAAAKGRTLAWAYAVESAGAGVGAAAATVAFAGGLPTFTLAVLVAGFVPSVLLISTVRRHSSALRKVRVGQDFSPVLLLLLLALTASAAFMAPSLDLRMTAWSHPSVVDFRDSPYARITATSAGAQTALFVDDVLVYESETARHEELAHLAALHHPAPRRILVLGGSAERLDRDLRQHGPDRLDAVELDRKFFEVADRQLKLGPSPVFDDPRNFLRRSSAFDLIVVAMPQPTSGQSNRFYTAEFFAECRQRMAEGGVLAFRLEMPENVVTPLVALRVAGILSAVGSAFPHVELLQGTSAIVIASARPLPAGADVLVERWQSRGIAARLVTPAYLRYLFLNDRRLVLNRLRDAGAAPNSDARPIAYQIAAATWLAKFFPGLLGVEAGRFTAGDGSDFEAARLRAERFGGSAVAGRRREDPRDGIDGRVLAAGVVAVVFALARWRRRVRAALLAGVAGFSGMVLETVLLLAYQARSGALFERLGILLMLFMVGLAIGAWSVGRLLSRRHRPNHVHRTTAGLLAASAVFGALTVALQAASAAMGLVLTGVMLCGVGATVAGVFACAAVSATDAGSAAPGRLYGADLAGGALGSLVAGLALVPMAGLLPTAWVVVAVSVLALLLV
jgi:spermidine synthase